MTDDRRCPYMDSCEMYHVFNLSGALEVWKTNYCRADFTKCERYERAMCGRHVPLTLLPNGRLLKKPST